MGLFLLYGSLGDGASVFSECAVCDRHKFGHLHFAIADVQTDGTDTAAGTDASSTTAPDAEASSTSESQSEESTQGADAAEQETTGPEQKEVRGYYASIGIRYEAGYAGLKEMIA